MPSLMQICLFCGACGCGGNKGFCVNNEESLCFHLTTRNVFSFGSVKFHDGKWGFS